MPMVGMRSRAVMIAASSRGMPSRTMANALLQYRDDVLAGRYPSDAESYHWPAGLREQFERWTATPQLKAKG